MDPVEGIEEAKSRTGSGVGRCDDLKHAVSRRRWAGDVAREPLGISGRDRFSGKNRKSGMDPRKESVHETLRQTFLLMQAAQEEAAKQLADGGGIERGKFEKLSFSSPDSIGNHGVAVRIEVSLRRNRTSG